MLTATLTTNLRNLASQIVKINTFVQTSRRSLCSKPAGKEILNVLEDGEDVEEMRAKEAALEEKRNKSGLFPQDFNRQHDKPPYEEPMFDHHETLFYRRRLYGKYGKMSNVDPSILWPNKEELAAMKDYEGVAHPFTFHQLVKRDQEKKALEAKQREEAEAAILEKVKGIDAEIAAFNKRKAAQERKVQEVIEKKNKLIEKVRQHFGYRIDTRDARFKAMLAELEMEEKKQAKAAKKAKQKARMEAFLLHERSEENAEEMSEEKSKEKSENKED